MNPSQLPTVRKIEKVAKRYERLTIALYPLAALMDTVTLVSNHWPKVPKLGIPDFPVLAATTAVVIAVGAHSYFKWHKSHNQNLRLMDQLAEAKKQIERLQSERDAEAAVRAKDVALEQAKAICDSERAKALNPQLLGASERFIAVHSAILRVNENIYECLRVLCLNLEDLGKSPVAASIKTIVEWGSGERQLDGAKVRTVYRDPVTRTSRGEHDHTLYEMDDNTAMRKVFRCGQSRWTCNDLQAAFKNGSYKNMHEGWQGRYNATSVCSISSLCEEMGIPRNGMLCVDSLCGKFDARCEKEVEKMSYRIAFLLFQAYALDEIYEQLSKEIPKNKASKPLLPFWPS
jgi:hypothetical protein